MNIIRRLLGHRRAERASTPSQPDATAESRFSEAGSRNATRRELIRVVLRDALRRHGIPAAWLLGEILTVAGRNQQTRMHVRLVVRHWDERLLRYAFAFERSFLREIERFEPQAADWLRSISWQIAADSGCPYPEMPEPTMWGAPVTNEDPAADVREDLERLFAIRDLENAKHAARDSDEPGSDFEPTQPSTLEAKPDRH